MTRSAKLFRIERTSYADVPVDAIADERHQELVSLIESLRGSVGEDNGGGGSVSETIVEDMRKQIAEAREIKSELDMIHEAIHSTKRELATLHSGSFDADGMTRVTNELDAVVAGTEQATEQILASAEKVDALAGDLGAMVTDPTGEALANDIQEQVVTIFEACNFQDLTGQRITKVVTTLTFIEERVSRMMHIWGGLEAFRDVAPDSVSVKDEQEALLNGPSLPDDETSIGQDDIDALFN